MTRTKIVAATESVPAGLIASFAQERKQRGVDSHRSSVEAGGRRALDYEFRDVTIKEKTGAQIFALPPAVRRARPRSGAAVPADFAALQSGWATRGDGITDGKVRGGGLPDAVRSNQTQRLIPVPAQTRSMRAVTGPAIFHRTSRFKSEATNTCCSADRLCVMSR